MYPIQSSLHCNLHIEQIFPGIRNWNFYLIHKFYDLEISYLRAAFVPLSILQLVGGSRLASWHALKNNETGSYFYHFWVGKSCQCCCSFIFYFGLSRVLLYSWMVYNCSHWEVRNPTRMISYWISPSCMKRKFGSALHGCDLFTKERTFIFSIQLVCWLVIRFKFKSNTIGDESVCIQWEYVYHVK